MGRIKKGWKLTFLISNKHLLYFVVYLTYLKFIMEDVLFWIVLLIGLYVWFILPDKMMKRLAQKYGITILGTGILSLFFGWFAYLGVYIYIQIKYEGK